MGRSSKGLSDESIRMIVLKPLRTSSTRYMLVLNP
jgi:hypothetical protein